MLGNECAGEVVAAVGSRVRRFKAGDRVIGRPGIRRLGAFAEFCCVPEAAVFPMAPGLSFEQAACLPIAGVTALQALRDKGQVSYSKKVLINGAAGGVGHFAVQIAKIFGADVTGVCSTGNIESRQGRSERTGSSTIRARTSRKETPGTTSSSMPLQSVPSAKPGGCLPTAASISAPFPRPASS